MTRYSPMNFSIRLISDDELSEISVQELLERFANQPQEVLEALKSRRRQLKNREYAANVRRQTVNQKESLENQSAILEDEIEQLRKETGRMQQELEIWQRNRKLLEDVVGNRRKLLILS